MRPSTTLLAAGLALACNQRPTADMQPEPAAPADARAVAIRDELERALLESIAATNSWRVAKGKLEVAEKVTDPIAQGAILDEISRAQDRFKASLGAAEAAFAKAESAGIDLTEYKRRYREATAN